jgi:hypothetical protein
MVLLTQLPADVRAQFGRDAAAASLNAELRKEFVATGLFDRLNTERVAADEDAYRVVADVPMHVVHERLAPLFAEREDAEAARRYNEFEAAKAELAAAQPAPTPVVEAPKAETKPAAPVARPSQAEALRRLAARTRTGPQAPLPERKPAPAPKATAAPRPPAPKPTCAPAQLVERFPGNGECWCTGCPRRHVIAVADAFVPAIPELRKQFREGPPSREQLVELARCRHVFRDETGIRWYRLEDTLEEIGRRVAERARAQTDRAMESLGGKLADVFRQADHRAARKAKAERERAAREAHAAARQSAKPTTMAELLAAAEAKRAAKSG